MIGVSVWRSWIWSGVVGRVGYGWVEHGEVWWGAVGCDGIGWGRMGWGGVEWGEIGWGREESGPYPCGVSTRCEHTLNWLCECARMISAECASRSGGQLPQVIPLLTTTHPLPSLLPFHINP